MPTGIARQAHTYPVTSRIENQARSDRALTVFLFVIKEFPLCKDMYGIEIAASIEDLMRRAVEDVGRDGDDPGRTVCLGAGEILHIRPRHDSDPGSVADQAFMFKTRLQAVLRRHTIATLGREMEITVGFAMRDDVPSPHDHATREAVHEARRMALDAPDLETPKLSPEFRDILAHDRLTVLFQPIHDFKTGAIMAWEALTRGPRGSAFHSPVALFDFAEKTEQLFLLEQACRTKAMRTVGKLGPGQRLFLNIHPRTVVDPGFAPGKTLELLEQFDLVPENIVLEITERHSIKNFTAFHKTLDHYRSQGFRIAVDDAGTGYSGLSTIAALRPDFIKVDMGLVRDVDKDPIRRALMETMVALAERIGSEIIAEGIETRGEASALIDIGVHHGQGYFLNRPRFPKTESGLDLKELAPVRPDSWQRLACSIPIGRLAQPAITVSPRMPVHSVQHIFATNPNLPAVVVAEDGRPMGLVMGYNLDRHLATLYGRALYAGKPISVLMDSQPMIVDEREPVEVVAKNANTRETLKAYDEVVVTRNGSVLGAVSVQSMLSTLAQVQVEMAKGTNPLTGIPGNVALEKELEQRLRRGQPFCMLYADLDYFKVFNDVYGFKDGDQVILLLGRILTWALTRHGHSGDFLAHIGGDDFVAIVAPDKTERICRAVVRCFKRLIPRHYSDQDSARGWIEGKGRDGAKQRFPLVSVSIGIVECHAPCSLHTLGERAAQIKSYAKSLPGNVYVRDRRGRKDDEPRATR
ncbi:MAG: GGDEF domain-containing protein [Deltaproteobacteria bacterium]|nr:GGDEF domain-containing protein [Deltaproteobacteria bacterium]